MIDGVTSINQRRLAQEKLICHHLRWKHAERLTQTTPPHPRSSLVRLADAVFFVQDNTESQSRRSFDTRIQSTPIGATNMHDYAGSFLIYLARDNQNRILKEAGVSQQLHQAREQNEPRKKGFVFAAWLADVMGLRSSKKLLG